MASKEQMKEILNKQIKALQDDIKAIDEPTPESKPVQGPWWNNTEPMKTAPEEKEDVHADRKSAKQDR